MLHIEYEYKKFINKQTNEVHIHNEFLGRKLALLCVHKGFTAVLLLHLCDNVYKSLL